jgi:hypothetical protein
MNLVFSTLKKVLFWSYERGSWQYDVMCVLILAFIFALPSVYFHSRNPRPIQISSHEIVKKDNQSIEDTIGSYVMSKYGSDVKISRIQTVTDSSGQVEAYLVWEKN